MSSDGQKRTVLLRYIRFKRGARCVLMRAEIGSRVQSRGNVANQIHGFTIDYGKFILKKVIDQQTTDIFIILVT